MKKVKKIFRNIIIFLVAMGVCILPTVIFKTEEEIIVLLRQPEYWLVSVFIAAAVTWQFVQGINDSEK